MRMSVQTSVAQGNRWIIAYRCLVYTALLLSLAILWGETRGQSTKAVMQGVPMEAGLVCGTGLLFLSLVFWRRLGRWSLYGFATGTWTLVVWLIPTMD